MLNPECVDYNQGKVKIVFTDDSVDRCLTEKQINNLLKK